MLTKCSRFAAELNVVFFFKNHACFGKIYMLVFNIRTSLRSATEIFEDHEEAFFDNVESIPADRLKAEPELAEKIYKLALAVDSEYYDGDSDPYEDSPERLPDRIKEYYEENIYYNHAGSDRCILAGK